MKQIDEDWPAGIDYLSPKIKAYLQDAKIRALHANAPGMLEMGNINLTDRPGFPTPDNGYSNAITGTFGIDGGRTVLLPTVVNGILHNANEAFEHFKNTGEHMGIFDSRKAADAFDKALHEQMGWTGKKNKWEK